MQTFKPIDPTPIYLILEGVSKQRMPLRLGA